MTSLSVGCVRVLTLPKLKGMSHCNHFEIIDGKVKTCDCLLLSCHLEFTIFLFVCLFINLFIFGCVGSSLLHTGFLFSCSERGLLFFAVHRPLIKVASLVAEHRL